MLGPQAEIEIRLWCDEVARCRKKLMSPTMAATFADDLLAAYSTRYGLPQPAADDRLGRAAIEAMDAIIEVVGDEDQSNQHKASAIDQIATRYVAARWHIQRETGK